MKKTLVALAVLSAATIAQAAQQPNTFYAGAKAGWSSFHDGLTQFDTKNGGAYSINRNSLTTGVYGGYQIVNQNNVGLAVELGYDYFGRVRGNVNQNRAAKHSAHGVQISLKPSYEVAPNLDVYGKVGAALVRNDYKQYMAVGDDVKAHNLKTSLVLGTGVEYAITPELAARVEYQYLNRAGNLDKAIKKANITTWGNNTQYAPDIHSVSAGLTYRFGQAAAPVEMPASAPVVAAPELFKFDSKVLFDFGKSNLRPAGAAALDSVISQYGDLTAVEVGGYTDRIGTAESNVKLSQRRAETVANYIVSKGVNPASVTAVGYGAANPVTGNTCDAVKGRKALVACLEPDRRVELKVQGTKK